MPNKKVVSDEALSRALGIYAGMVGQVLNNPRRWLGVDEEPPRTAGWPIRVLDAVRDRALGDVTPASPHWAAQPESKRVEWIRRIAVGAALAARRAGSRAHSLTASRCKPRSAPPPPGWPSAPSPANVAMVPPLTGFRFSQR